MLKVHPKPTCQGRTSPLLRQDAGRGQGAVSSPRRARSGEACWNLLEPPSGALRTAPPDQRRAFRHPGQLSGNDAVGKAGRHRRDGTRRRGNGLVSPRAGVPKRWPFCSAPVPSLRCSRLRSTAWFRLRTVDGCTLITPASRRPFDTTSLADIVRAL